MMTHVMSLVFQEANKLDFATEKQNGDVLLNACILQNKELINIKNIFYFKD